MRNVVLFSVLVALVGCDGRTPDRPIEAGYGRVLAVHGTNNDTLLVVVGGTGGGWRMTCYHYPNLKGRYRNGDLTDSWSPIVDDMVKVVTVKAGYGARQYDELQVVKP